MQKRSDVAVILWGALAGFSFCLSVIWNIVDTSTGGISNAPADDDNEEEDILEDDEEEPLVINE